MRKKMFIMLCLSLSVIFFCSYFLIYIIFQKSMRQEIQQQQLNLLQFNESIFTGYINSLNMIPFQLVNDEEIGTALNIDSSLYLDMFRAKEKIRKGFTRYLDQQLFSSNLSCRLILYLNEDIPVSSYCDDFTLSEQIALRTSRVYANSRVLKEEWYQRTMEITWSPYFFINSNTDELCYAKCIQNFYVETPSQNGIGVIVIGIPTASILDKLFLKSVTPNSCIILQNEYREILYQHGAYQPSGQQKDAVTEVSAETSLFLEDKNYITNTVSVKNDLYLTFLTPYSDIEVMVSDSLHTYILFSAFTFLILILIIYIISRRITAPIISFSELLKNIEDTRTFDTNALNLYKDAELRILCDSFLELITRENRLIDRIDEEYKAKRSAVLHALQAQINPHFLYNALDMVSWMALSRKDDTVADVISSISNMMHYSISQPDSTVTLRQEIDNIHEFIRICEMKEPCDIKLSVCVNEERELDILQIPKFTLQPLIENSILHNPEIEKLCITITVCAESNGFTVTVTDDGAGADPEKLNAFLQYQDTDLIVSNGFGIRNVNERIQLHYPKPASLSYELSPDGHLAAILTIVTAAEATACRGVKADHEATLPFLNLPGMPYRSDRAVQA